jgi:hypothetical protein
MEKKKVSDLLQEQRPGYFDEYIVGNAPTIMGVFANLVVIFADYRAYDVIYSITGSWWKALAASLACAVPFILWEIAWQYNHTTETWRKWSLAMAGLAFGTSIILGVADYLQFTAGYWADLLLAGVVVLTGIHTVVGFLYYYNDPDVARRRRKAQALAQMQDQELNAEIAKSLLTRGDELIQIIEELGSRHDPEEVEKVMNILQGKKARRDDTVKRQVTTLRPVRTFGAESENPTKPPR